MTWHQTTVVGNLGSDPELRYLQSGDAVCNFSVAANSRRRNPQTDQWEDHATWYRVSVWGNQAESCNTYLAKGRKVLVTGNVQARAYINNNGEAAASLELRAREVRFLSSREDGGGRDWGGGQQSGGWQGGGQRGGQQRGQSQQSDRASNYPDQPASVDDIPF